MDGQKAKDDSRPQGDRRPHPPRQASRGQPSHLTRQIPGARGRESERGQVSPPCGSVMTRHHTPAPAHKTQSPPAHKTQSPRESERERQRQRERERGLLWSSAAPGLGECVLPRRPAAGGPSLQRWPQLDGQVPGVGEGWWGAGETRGVVVVVVVEVVVVVVVVLRDAVQAGRQAGRQSCMGGVTTLAVSDVQGPGPVCTRQPVTLGDTGSLMH